MDQVNYRGLNSASECLNLPSSDDSENKNYISDMVDHLEEMRHNIFVEASQNIKEHRNNKLKVTMLYMVVFHLK